MRRGLKTVLAMTVGAGFAATQGAWAAEPPPSYRLASYATTQRPEQVRECLLSLVANSRTNSPERTFSNPTQSPDSLGFWEIEFQYRGVPTRIVVEPTSIRGARVTYPVSLAWNAPADVESCG
jgi:hypothetical protein